VTWNERAETAMRLLYPTWDDMPQHERRLKRNIFDWNVEAAVAAGLVDYPTPKGEE